MSDFVKAGQLIGSRYRLTEKDTDQLPYPGVSVWRADDTTLKHSVRILVLDPQGKYFSETLDAARRSSLFDDAHVVKILVVDSDSDHGWIATEIPLGTPLSYRLHGEPFSLEQAKTLVGETARIIASASAHGVRHLDVKPSDVRVDSHGQIFLDGLAVHAALAGIRTDTIMPNELDRKEADSLTRLYAQLLSGDPIIDADTAVHDLSQSEDIDSSLQYFFEKSLRGAGALSASDLIRNLGSWTPVTVAALPDILDAHVEAADAAKDAETDAEGVDPELGIPQEPALSTEPKWPAGAGDDAQEEVDENDVSVVEDTEDTETDKEVEDAEDIESAEAETVEDISETDDTFAHEAEKAEESSVAHDESVANEGLGDEENAFGEEDSPADTVVESDDKSDGLPSEQSPSENRADTGDTQSSDKSPEKKNFLSAIAAKTSQTSKQFSQKTASGIASVAGSKVVRDAMTSLERHMDKVSDIPEGGGERRFNTAWLFTAISVALVVVAGLWAVLLFFSTPKVEVVNQGPTGPAINIDKAPGTEIEDTDTGNLLVESVELLNPQEANVPTSRDQDNPDKVDNAADGDTSTVWESWWYPTPHYTIGKDGVGLRITLKEPLVIENISVQVNGTGGNIQWLAGEPGADAQVLAESVMSPSTSLVPAQPVTSDTVILWINELPVDKAKKNRIVIAEIDFNKTISDVMREAAQSE